MRGRLVFKFSAELYRLDARGMATVDPNASGPLTAGYDPDFKEPALVDRDGDSTIVGIRFRPGVDDLCI